MIGTISGLVKFSMSYMALAGLKFRNFLLFLIGVWIFTLDLKIERKRAIAKFF